MVRNNAKNSGGDGRNSAGVWVQVPPSLAPSFLVPSSVMLKNTRGMWMVSSPSLPFNIDNGDLQRTTKQTTRTANTKNNFIAHTMKNLEFVLFLKNLVTRSHAKNYTLVLIFRWERYVRMIIIVLVPWNKPSIMSSSIISFKP